MVEEPTNSELARRLDDIQRTLGALVGQAQYTADQRREDDRYETLRRDIAEERRDRDEAVRVLHQRVSDEAERVNQRVTDEARRGAESRLSWRTIIYTGLIPAAVVGISVLVQVWLHGGT